MKLSEILAKPMKLKGGGVLNIKGFSKQVVDKELDNNNDDNFFTKLFTLEDMNFLNPHPTKAVKIIDDAATVIDLEPDTDFFGIYPLYKKSDIDPTKETDIIMGLITRNTLYPAANEEGIMQIKFYTTKNVNLVPVFDGTVDGEEYVAFDYSEPA